MAEVLEGGQVESVNASIPLVLKTTFHCLGFLGVLLLECKNRYVPLKDPVTCWRGQNRDRGVRGSELSAQ